MLPTERGAGAQPTAADVVKLCTGELTVGAIVDRSWASIASQPREAMEREVLDFLTRMAERGLVTGDDA